ncbi:MAG: hypothetical protein ACPG7F_11290 [Aggregatilineales bacterium]
MHVERYSAPRRRNTISPGCACLSLTAAGGIIAVIAIMLLIPLINRALLGAVGLEAEGDTAAIFTGADNNPVLTTGANSTVSSGVILRVGDIGQQSLNPTGNGYSIRTGSDDRGRIMQASFDESALLMLCNRYTEFCRASGNPLRNAVFDVRPGGGLISGDVYIEQTGLWQAVNIVVQVNNTGSVTIAGVDVNGTLYNAAPDAAMNDIFREAETLMNSALRQLTVDAGNVPYRVETIYTDDQTVHIILR